MSEIEVIAIEGLDAAIIGSTLRNGREVLAYDIDKAVEILVSHGYSAEYAEEWIEEMCSNEFEGSPAFVYVNEEPEFHGTGTPIGVTVH